MTSEPDKQPPAAKDDRMENTTEIKVMPVEGKKEAEKDDAIELLKAMGFAAVIALVIRSFLFEPFNIPSGSMFPTLLVGDYLFVEKYSYGYSKYSFPGDFLPITGRFFFTSPKRGDVAVFRQPKHPEIDYIKRIIGLPGDRIQVKEGRLYINDKMVPRDLQGTEQYRDEDMDNLYSKYIEMLPNGVKHYIYEITDDGPNDNTQVYEVPDGMYFAMGDNRDASQDSRFLKEVGFVPAENLIGRAAFIFYSTEGLGDSCKESGGLAALKNVACMFWTYPQAVRYNRIFRSVNSL
jgi:signal peptidase I